jgi:hypothetical protein
MARASETSNESPPLPRKVLAEVCHQPGDELKCEERQLRAETQELTENEVQWIEGASERAPPLGSRRRQARLTGYAPIGHGPARTV